MKDKNATAIELVGKYKNPCAPAMDWIAGKSVKDAWESCERADWMIWFYARAFPENTRELTLVKGHIAHTVIHLMKDPRSVAAVYAAIRFGENLIDEQELKEAAIAARAAADDASAYAPNKATSIAAYAACTACTAAIIIPEASAVAVSFAASTVPTCAADAITTYAADDPATTYREVAIARENSLKNSADICRRYLKIY